MRISSCVYACIDRESAAGMEKYTRDDDNGESRKEIRCGRREGGKTERRVQEVIDKHGVTFFDYASVVQETCERAHY